jgi:hypothetical protein
LTIGHLDVLDETVVLFVRRDEAKREVGVLWDTLVRCRTDEDEVPRWVGGPGENERSEQGECEGCQLHGELLKIGMHEVDDRVYKGEGENDIRSDDT